MRMWWWVVVEVFRTVEEIREGVKEKEEGVVWKGIRELRTEGGCSEENGMW